MAVELNGKVWKKFVEFFRNEKGYDDWTEQEIEDSRNDDDITEFLEWLVKKSDTKMLVKLEDGGSTLADWVEMWHETNVVLVGTGDDVGTYSVGEINKIERGE